jgi:hypothetical protein
MVVSCADYAFDGIPAARRVKAYEMHGQGWAAQMKSIAEYLVKAA